MPLGAVHLTFMKLFDFPEPLFYPKDLKKGRSVQKKVLSLFQGEKNYNFENFRFFSDPEKIRKKINQINRLNLDGKDYPRIEGFGTFKHIKNLDIKEDRFWIPFRPKRPATKESGEEPFPYYPFQFLPEKKLKLGIPASRLPNTPLLDYNSSYQIRLYPPGIGSFHIHLYYRQQALDWDFLEWISNPGNNIFRSDGKVFDFFSCYKSSVGLLMKKISNLNPLTREILDCYRVINLQGDQGDDLKDSSHPIHKIFEQDKVHYVETPQDCDIILVGDNLSMFYVDKGIKERGSSKVRKGRRCFRCHFINAIELAYTSIELSKIYSDYVKKCSDAAKIAALDKSLKSEIRKIFRQYLVKPKVYSTLIQSLHDIPDNLRESGSPVYLDTLRAFYDVKNFPSILTELQDHTRVAYEVAVEYDLQKEVFGNIYKEIKDWTKIISDLLKITLEYRASGKQSQKGTKDSQSQEASDVTP